MSLWGSPSTLPIQCASSKVGYSVLEPVCEDARDERLAWVGQYKSFERAKERLQQVIPFTLMIVVLLLYLGTRSWIETSIVLLAVPFSLLGAVWLLFALDYHVSVAVWVGMIALAGLDAETGVVMLLYLSLTHARHQREGRIKTFDDLLGGAHEVTSPARALTQTFACWKADADPSVGIDLRAAVVTRIASRALAHGHGGMILLIPSTLKEPAGVSLHYAIGEGHDVLAQRYAEVIREIPVEQRLERLRGSRERGYDGRVYVRDEIQIAFAEAIELVARLTGVDNAVLMDTDLMLRGFGVQVIEAHAPQIAFTHTNPYSHDAHIDDLSTFKGTRHPAGVIFCLRQAGEAAAIIASQDRRLSLASKNADGNVEVLGSYEHAFGWR
jgi:hypothetical protein